MGKCLKVDVAEFLRFFDEAPADSHGHATAIVGVCGEDLGIGLLQRYLKETEGLNSRVVFGENGQAKAPSPGTRRGNRLDRWLLVEPDWRSNRGRTVYQVEIKNWSAHAIDGKRILSANEDWLVRYRKERWLQCWSPERNGFLKDNAMSKVLTRMHPPETDFQEGLKTVINPPIRQEEIAPMLCFWWALHPEGEAAPLFRQPLPDGGVNGFDACWVFSMSNYLRSLSEKEISLEMPSTLQRLGWLQRLFRDVPEQDER